MSIIFLSDQEISKFMEIALIGIKHWCKSAIVKSQEYRGMTCDALAAGYTLELHDSEMEEIHQLTRSGLIEGLELYTSKHQMSLKGDRLDLEQISTTMADHVIQYAIFGEVQYYKPANAEFAKVSWQLGDVLEATKERGISLTEQKAAELLEGVEKQLSEAMIATGWGVIYEALDELKPKLLSKIRELASKLQYPSLAICEIRFLDDNTTKIVTIALYDSAPDEDDETVFYYAGSVSGLISLAQRIFSPLLWFKP